MSPFDDREALAAANLGRCEGIARKMTRRRPWDYDEAYSVALVALDEAIRKSPVTAETVVPEEYFGNHADHIISWRVADHLRRDRPKGYRSSRERKTQGFCPAVYSADLADHDPADDRLPVGWEVDSEDFVLALSRRLPRRDQEVFRVAYLHAAAAGSQRRAAALLGITQARVSQIIERSVAMLRERYAANPGRVA